jgi:hypothetical protein
VTDQELRALVREAIAKQLGEPAPAGGWRGMTGRSAADARLHVSHGVYTIARHDAPHGASDDPENGPCLIEPSVPCTHCNYCKSHGH